MSIGNEVTNGLYEWLYAAGKFSAALLAHFVLFVLVLYIAYIIFYVASYFWPEKK